MISTAQNPKIKYVRALQNRRRREREGVFVLEGLRLVEEAVAAGVRPRLVLYNEDGLSRTKRGRQVLASVRRLADEAHAATEQALRAASETENPQGLIVVAPVPVPPAANPNLADAFWLIVDGLQDPGNLGTLLRSAWAAGVSDVWLAPGTVDVYSGKVVRSAMGAHFHLAIRPVDDWDEISTPVRGLRTVVAADARAERSIYEVDWRGSLALIVSNEAWGLSENARRVATITASIPMRGPVESLNVAVAGSIILFEAMHQRTFA